MVYQLNDVSVHYTNQAAIQHVNCTIQKGKFISVIGQTGAGKSTFVQVLKGLIPAIDGDYLVHRQPVNRDAKGQIKVVPEIGFVFQYPEHQLFETTVQKELAFGPKQRGFSSQQITESIKTILPQVGLSEEILPFPPFQLSGGQKRRVAIASVLMMDPELLIADEPTAGLDPASRVDMLQLLKNWQLQENRTLICVSHQLEDVAEYSDEVIVFHAGQLRGHYDTNTLFLEQSQLLQDIGLPLPEPIQLLKMIEELSGRNIEVASCREEDIFKAIMPIWKRRGI
ncbi:energy-coupling factor transporter ATP-binding protein EcfA2 [Paenibacillus sp. J23TS9]|uniref:ATP-binding cassette domain-containing protein n=1 Tax=Paenibacillus sp. J23TS9 TaxID=2807193 RepID=UPI001B155065|nr:ATP-binding cassette domain-containing protein [Paenibacillus sp. J23TS9]GIP26647.1 energy-coupling factor transporter ATP-binding protein EcfA2 [Paenibacillus sp. J23TS9]